MLQSTSHLLLTVLIIAWRHNAFGRVGADHKHHTRKKGRLLREGRGSGYPDRFAPAELLQTLADLGGGERGFVDVGDAELEGHGLAQHSGGDVGQLPMSFVYGMESPRKQGRRRRCRGPASTVHFRTERGHLTLEQGARQV